MENLQAILNLVLVILVVVVAGLAAIYFLIFSNNNGNKSSKNEENTKKEKKGSDAIQITQVSKESMYKFIEFDDVKDNMIVRKNGEQYVMVIGCQGVNYDLMSSQEKLSIEEGFVQFLNTLRFPIQLYVQTSSLNLRDIIEEYKGKVREVETELIDIREKIKDAKSYGDTKALAELEFQEKRKNNVWEYGQDMAAYIERLSLNKNVLQQKTYVIVSYFASEFGATNYSKEELESLFFSELYTRCQTIIRSLASCEVTGNVLDSEELAELLYTAYNRDDAELVQLSKALDTEYDALYTTSQDVLEKKQELIEEQINADAVTLTTDSIISAEAKMKAKERKNKVVEKALDLIGDYEEQIEPDLFSEIKKEIKDNGEILTEEYEEEMEMEQKMKPVKEVRK